MGGHCFNIIQMKKYLTHLVSINVESDSVLVTGMVEQEQSGEESTTHLPGLGGGDARHGAGCNIVHTVEVVLDTLLSSEQSVGIGQTGLTYLDVEDYATQMNLWGTHCPAKGSFLLPKVAAMSQQHKEYRSSDAQG